MTQYELDHNKFTIHNYNRQRPFASFLPGIAGIKGIPLWAFYVNRAQGISGYGVRDKNQPLMPFTPANKAYESVAVSGFRTFIKKDGQLYEPFHIASMQPHQMSIHPSSFELSDTHVDWGLHTSVKYFGIPQETIPGLVRKVEITNQSQTEVTLEILDGIAEFLPFGIQNDVFKSLSNIMASWVSVEHLEKGIGFYKLRSSTNDSSEVKEMREGHFYIALHKGQLVSPIADPSLVFGHDTSKQYPFGFAEQSVDSLQQVQQVTSNMIPSAFIPLRVSLQPNETTTLYALSGYVKNIEELEQLLDNFSLQDYWLHKEAEAEDVVSSITKEVQTKSAYPLFDAYIEQCYLDNVLRGGYPVTLGTNTYHLFSRRHGDLERDYNFFSLSPEPYSQGNGNFRDVCQNRRLDVVFHPEVQRSTIYQFLSLIQLDGYNPLAINGLRFELSNTKPIKSYCHRFGKDAASLIRVLQTSFTPGELYQHLKQLCPMEEDVTSELFDLIMSEATPQVQAQFGEGYWIDHFTYVLDLIESYVGIYPDHIEDLLYQDESYRYFESPASVKPLSEKITTNQSGNIRQYHGLRHMDETKMKRLKMDPHQTQWTTYQDQEYRTNLFVKLLTLVLNKHALLDRFDYGIEMEADKPGWNDAMNGLPGLFGSGISETIELIRVLNFLIRYQQSHEVVLLGEVATLFESLSSLPGYEKRLSAREQYREAIRFGPQEQLQSVKSSDVFDYFERLRDTLQEQLLLLSEEHQNIPPTFLYSEINDYSIGRHQVVKTNQVSMNVLPPFLEAPARWYKLGLEKSRLQKMHEAILSTSMYDKQLGIFKTSASLENETHEIGRIKAFTPGWLERESDFLHMTYKYLLGLLSAGLYEAFYDVLFDNMVCFMKPEVYGRSPLENSSFIAPTNNPDSRSHGQGFFARLSGSTIEALHMWYIMMTGGEPFRIEKGELVFSLRPKLHHSFFDANGDIQFRLFHRLDVTIRNKNKVSTYDQFDVHSIDLGHQGEWIRLPDTTIRGEIAEQIRSGYYDSMLLIINE